MQLDDIGVIDYALIVICVTVLVVCNAFMGLGILIGMWMFCG